jgi:hypothetical protein
MVEAPTVRRQRFDSFCSREQPIQVNPNVTGTLLWDVRVIDDREEAFNHGTRLGKLFDNRLVEFQK